MQHGGAQDVAHHGASPWIHLRLRTAREPVEHVAPGVADLLDQGGWFVALRQHEGVAEPGHGAGHEPFPVEPVPLPAEHALVGARHLKQRRVGRA